MSDAAERLAALLDRILAEREGMPDVCIHCGGSSQAVGHAGYGDRHGFRSFREVLGDAAATVNLVRIAADNLAAKGHPAA